MDKKAAAQRQVDAAEAALIRIHPELAQIEFDIMNFGEQLGIMLIAKKKLELHKAINQLLKDCDPNQ